MLTEAKKSFWAILPFLLFLLIVNFIQILAFPTNSDYSTEQRFTKHVSTAQRVRSHGYPGETHYVDTADGYVLGLFRIPYSPKLQNEFEKRPAVLLFHGLFSCSDAYILTGPDSGLAYNLADAGYDVWLGNARGNYYSKNSTKYSVHHPYFWRFSWHEMGINDVTGMIDYVLAKSGEDRLHYIGHSQGTTTFMVAMSTRPEYNGKIKTAHLLAPVAYMEHVTDPMFVTLSQYLGHQGTISAFFGTQEFLPHNSLFMQLLYTMCGQNSPNLGLCSSAAVLLEGYAPNANTTIFPILAETHPAGASTDQILHYMQSMSTNLFRLFDYGTRKNIEVYKTPEPPAYDLKAITAPVWLYYGDNDNLATTKDVQKLATELPNVQGEHHVEDPTWSHADFTWGLRAKEEINDPVLEAMNDYEENSKNQF